MRGNTACPLRRRGEESGTVGVPVGSAVGVEAGVVVGGWVTPGGAVGVITNGLPKVVPEPVPAVARSAASGRADVDGACGQGSVRKCPFTSLVRPLRQRATTRKR
jgi:hypothetical protein